MEDYLLYRLPIEDSGIVVEGWQFLLGQNRVMVTDGYTTATQF